MTEQLSSMGYDVIPEDGMVQLVNRFTWSRNYQTAVFLSCSALLAVLGLLVSEGVIAKAAVSASFLFSFAVGLAIYSIAARALLSPKRGKNVKTPAEVFVVNPARGELQTRGGEAVSSLDGVRAEIRVDWWATWGLVSYVRLSWDGGQRIVFRAFGRTRTVRVFETLCAFGIASGS